MRRFHSSRLVLVLALLFTAALGTPPVWGQPTRLEVTSTFSQLWVLFASLWDEACCILDPYGGCTAGQGGTSAAEGCGLDPHGVCPASPSRSVVEEGCILDPHGGCARSQSLPTADAGCGVDPHGGCSH